MTQAVRVAPRGISVLDMCIRCVVMYFNLVCAVSSREGVVTQGPGGESRDVEYDEQQMLFVARPFEAAA